MAANQKLSLEKELIVIDGSIDGENGGSKEEEEEIKKKDGSENRSEHVFKTKAEEYNMLADLSSFPGLAAMFAAEASMREKKRRRNQVRRIKKKHTKVDNTDIVKIVNNCKPEDKTISESSCDGLQPPIELGPCLSSSKGEKVTGDSGCCRVQMASVATKVFLREEKNNKKQDNVPPRYFSPPESTWRTWHREDNHSAAQFRNRERRRVCFICADPGHEGKKCRKVNNCFICDRGGHLAKDCPQQDVVEGLYCKSCLKCGDSGHDMFSCNNTYCFDDLKNIQCYVCKGFGHLCCFDYAAEGPRQVSCYTCGKPGHFGSEKLRLLPSLLS